MPPPSDVLIVQSGEALPTQLGQRLREKGYATTIVSRLEGLFAEWSRFANPVLVLDLTISPNVAEKTVKLLIRERRRLRCPVIVVARESRRLSEVLSRYFAIAPVIESPCSIEDIVRLLTVAERALNRLGDRDEAVIDPPGEEGGDGAPELEASFFLESEGRGAQTRVRSAGELYFGEAERLGLCAADLDGDDLLRTVELGKLTEIGLAPNDERCLAAGRELIARAGRRGGRQIVRTVGLVGRLVRALRLPASSYETAAAAALLYSASFAEADPELLTRQYLSRRGRATRRRLSARLVESGEIVSAEFSRPDVGAVLDCFGKIVGGARSEAAPKETAEIAAIIFGAELVGRICFQNGYWNPRHAHRILQRLESGWIEEIPPALSCGLVRLVTAAVADRPRGFIVPRRLRRDPVLVARARACREAEISSAEARVALSDLVPGMRLSRPIETFDGVELLRHDDVLDHDLIWRLWRLAALRPLNAPVVVRRDEESAAGVESAPDEILESS